MNQLNLHLNINNAIEKTLQKIRSTMDRFNKSVLESSNNFNKMNKSGDIIQDNSKKTLKNTDKYNDTLKDTNKKLDKSKNTTKDIGEQYKKLVQSGKAIVTNTTLWSKVLGGIRNIAFRMIAPIASIFSVAAIIDATRAVLRHRDEMKALSYRMGHANDATDIFVKNIYAVAKNIGQTTENAADLVKALINFRVPIKNLRELATNAGLFSEITGVTADKAARLTGELYRTGKIGSKSIESILKVMVNVQRSVGLTSEEMEGLTDTIILATKAAEQLGRSSAFQEKMVKDITKLAGTFSQVGVSVGKANDLVEDLLDPSKLEDMIPLLTKFGIQMDDMMSGNVNFDTVNTGLINFGKELKSIGQTNLWQAQQLAEVWTQGRFNARELIAFAEASEKVTEDAKKSLAELVRDQRGGLRRFQVVLNYIKTTVGEALSYFAPVIEKIGDWLSSAINKIDIKAMVGQVEDFFNNLNLKEFFEKFDPRNINLEEILNKLKSTFESIVAFIPKIFDKKIWIAGGIALLLLMGLMRKRFFSMAVGFGSEMKKGARKAGDELSKSLKEGVDGFSKSLKDIDPGILSNNLGKEMKKVGKDFGDELEDSIDRGYSSIKKIGRGADDIIDRTEKTISDRRVRTNFSERRSADVTQRIIEGPGYERAQERANTAEAEAQARNIFNWTRKRQESHAEYLRQLSMGERPLSFMASITEKNNKQIERMLDMRRQERLILTERYDQERQIRSFRSAEIEERLQALGNMGELTSKQQKEQIMLIKERDKLERQVNGFKVKASKEEERFSRSNEKALRRMSQDQLRDLAKEIEDRRTVIKDSMVAGKIRKQQLEEENTYNKLRMKMQQDRIQEIKRELATGAESDMGLEQMNALNDELKQAQRNIFDIENALQGAQSETEEINQSYSQQNAQLETIEDQIRDIRNVTGQTVEDLSKLDKPLVEGAGTRFAKLMGSIGRTFRNNVNDTFDRARKSFVTVGNIISDRLNPKNLWKGWIARFRQAREERTERGSGGIRGLTRAIGGLGKKFLIFGGLATVIGGFVSGLIPVQKAMDVFSKITGKLGEALSPLIEKLVNLIAPILIDVLAALVPILAMLVNLLLPPLLVVLGLLVKGVGLLVQGIAGLIKELFLVPARIANMLPGKESVKAERLANAKARLEGNRILMNIVGAIDNLGTTLDENGDRMFRQGLEFVENPPITQEDMLAFQESLYGISDQIRKNGINSIKTEKEGTDRIEEAIEKEAAAKAAEGNRQFRFNEETGKWYEIDKGMSGADAFNASLDANTQATIDNTNAVTTLSDKDFPGISLTNQTYAPGNMLPGLGAPLPYYGPGGKPEDETKFSIPNPFEEGLWNFFKPGGALDKFALETLKSAWELLKPGGILDKFVADKWSEGVEKVKEWWNKGGLFPNLSEDNVLNTLANWITDKWNEGVNKVKEWWNKGGMFPEELFKNLSDDSQREELLKKISEDPNINKNGLFGALWEKWEEWTGKGGFFQYMDFERTGEYLVEKWNLWTEWLDAGGPFQYINFESIGPWIKSKWDEGINNIKEWWNNGGFFPNLENNMLDNLSTWIINKWDEGVNNIRSWWSKGGLFPEELFTNLSDDSQREELLKRVSSDPNTNANGMLGDAWEILKPGGDLDKFALETLKGAWEFLKPGGVLDKFVLDKWNEGIEKIKDLFKPIGEAISEKWNSWTEWLEAGGPFQYINTEKIGDFLIEKWNSWTEWLEAGGPFKYINTEKIGDFLIEKWNSWTEWLEAGGPFKYINTEAVGAFLVEKWNSWTEWLEAGGPFQYINTEAVGAFLIEKWNSWTEWLEAGGPFQYINTEAVGAFLIEKWNSWTEWLEAGGPFQYINTEKIGDFLVEKWNSWTEWLEAGGPFQYINFESIGTWFTEAFENVKNRFLNAINPFSKNRDNENNNNDQQIIPPAPVTVPQTRIDEVAKEVFNKVTAWVDTIFPTTDTLEQGGFLHSIKEFLQIPESGVLTHEVTVTPLEAPAPIVTVENNDQGIIDNLIELKNLYTETVDEMRQVKENTKTTSDKTAEVAESNDALIAIGAAGLGNRERRELGLGERIFGLPGRLLRRITGGE